MLTHQLCDREIKEGGLEASDIRTLEKLSWLVVLISYHEDMFDQIIKMNLLKFVI